VDAVASELTILPVADEDVTVIVYFNASSVKFVVFAELSELQYF
jgi:hypothetical protein